VSDQELLNLVAALRYTNAQLGALILAVEYPDGFNLPGALLASKETTDRINDFQMGIMDAHNIQPVNLPVYTFDK
jgi:hypothetical protein